MGSEMNTKVEGQAADEDNVAVLDDESGAGATNVDESNLENEGGAGEEEGADDSSVVVTIGEEAPPPEEEHASAPEWVRELRKKSREDQRKIRELEDRLKGATTAETKPAELGKKPSLEACDYDADKYESELAQWYEQKRHADDRAVKAKAEQKAQEDAWQQKLATYGKAKADLKVKDFEDAENVAQELFSVPQQGIILQGAENPALVIYALGKNPTKAKELAAITDPVKYAFAVAKLETQLKVTPRKAPPPEGTVTRGTGSVSGTVDSTLERLRAEAAKTGDLSKVVAYKRSKRDAK